MRPLRIGTRGSALARWQAAYVQRLLTHVGVTSELQVMTTTGDRGGPVPRGTPAKGLFTKEIEEALLDGRVDLAVHSLKDMMTVLPRGLTLGAVPVREDPRDVLVTRSGATLASLPPDSCIGTASLRRRAALMSLRSDLRIVPLHGNVPTRLARVAEGEIDGAILAAAGLRRLERTDPAVTLDAESFVPAAGQGALGVQVREHDRDIGQAVARINDEHARVATTAERAALAELESGCAVPIGAYCRSAGHGFALTVTVYAVDGSRCLTERAAVDERDPAAAGSGAARRLLERGAGALIAEAIAVHEAEERA